MGAEKGAPISGNPDQGFVLFMTGERSAGASDVGCGAPAQLENSQGQERKSISELSERLALRLT